MTWTCWDIHSSATLSRPKDTATFCGYCWVPRWLTVLWTMTNWQRAWRLLLCLDWCMWGSLFGVVWYCHWLRCTTLLPWAPWSTSFIFAYDRINTFGGDKILWIRKRGIQRGIAIRITVYWCILALWCSIEARWVFFSPSLLVQSDLTFLFRFSRLVQLMLFLLIIGLVASVVGYVGCFSVVQNSTSSVSPVSWLCLEVGLSVLWLAIWDWNPTGDDAPPLEIILKLDQHRPLPTCNKDNEEILWYKVLPLTRAWDFLKIITSFAGLIHPFSNPDLSIYYTLTQKCLSKESVPAEHSDSVNGPANAENHKLGELALYITVFDPKERTTRVYTRDNEGDIFYSTKSDAPIVDVGHFLLEVEIDVEIDPKGDPVSNDSNNLDSLQKHHQLILEHIHYRLGVGDVPCYAIENSWTMKVEDTISALQRLMEEGNGNDWKTTVEKGKEMERIEESMLLCDCLMHSSTEKATVAGEGRVDWIACRMKMITKETKERFQGIKGVEYWVDKQTVDKKPATISPNQYHILQQLILNTRILICRWLILRWRLMIWLPNMLDKLSSIFQHQIGKLSLIVYPSRPRSISSQPILNLPRIL